MLINDRYALDALPHTTRRAYLIAPITIYKHMHDYFSNIGIANTCTMQLTLIDTRVLKIKYFAF